MTRSCYCLGYLKERGVRTLRDLTAAHAPLLRRLKSEGLAVIRDVYGIDPATVRVFIHYHPQFYHLHVHFNLLSNNNGVQAERAHLVDDVCDVLKQGGYGRRTMRFRLGREEELAEVLGIK